MGNANKPLQQREEGDLVTWVKVESTFLACKNGSAMMMEEIYHYPTNLNNDFTA